MRKTDAVDGTRGERLIVVSVLPAVQWRSVNQPHADTFKCQCGAAGTCISNNMLAACVQLPSSCGSQLSLKPILGK